MTLFKTDVRVRYQETDRMGIAHHASYFGWFEVARTEFMRARGLPYAEMERRGVMLPVVDAWCRYLHSVDYDQQLTIGVQASADGARLKFHYSLWDDNGQQVAEAASCHAWTDPDGRARNPRRYENELWAVIVERPSA